MKLASIKHLTTCLFTSLMMTLSVSALPLQSDHGILVSVPVPGNESVALDQSGKGWDLSGEMLAYPVRNIMERYSVSVYSMYDDQNLYLRLDWKDPSPMINNVDAEGAPGEGWMSDALQMRLITDHGPVHMTAWYSSRSDRSVLHAGFGGPFSNVKVFTGEGTSLAENPTGVAMNFIKNTDQRGYSQIIKLPWSFLYRDPSVAKPGHEFTFTGEYYWGGPSGTTWPGVQWADPINQANPVRVVIYQSPHVWGKIRLSPEGNLPRKSTGITIDKRQGFIPIRMRVPEGSRTFTLVIDDNNGKRIRNLIANAQVEDYLVPGSHNEIEVLWDGRGDGPWNKPLGIFVGDPVPPGDYVVRGMVSEGIGVIHAGSFYNPNRPPWPTGNGIGGWGYDHSICTGLAALPPEYEGRTRIMAGWHHGETGVGFIALGEDGWKIGEWLRRGAGAYRLDAGPHYAYFAFSYNDRYVLGRVKPSPQPNGLIDQVDWDGNGPDVTLPGSPAGLTYAGNLIAVSFETRNEIRLYDSKTGRETQTIAIKRPTELDATPDFKQLVVVSKSPQASSLLLIDIASGNVTPLPQNQVKAPSAIAIDSNARLFVGDGADKTIKVLESVKPNAALLRTIGEPGGHVAGPWNPKRMNTPLTMTIEEDGDQTLIWVSESSSLPRRISVWNTANGALVRDYVGGTSYQASKGALSDNIPDLGIYETMKITVDYTNHSYQMQEILVDDRPVIDPANRTRIRIGKIVESSSFGFGNLTHRISDASGKNVEYLIDVSGIATKHHGQWLMTSVLGNKHTANAIGIRVPARLPDTAVFAWNDDNKNGFVDENETQWHNYGHPHMFNYGWAGGPDENLIYYHSGYAFAPARFDDDGAPVYDITQGQKLPGDVGNAKGPLRKTRFGWIGERLSPFHGPTTDAVHGMNEFVGYDSEGKLRWSYPNYWIAVHGGFTAPMATPGTIMGVLKVSSVFQYDEDHSIMSLRGNHGQEFLLRDDGIYLSELFTDQRMAPASLPATRNLKELIGMPINDTSLGGEPFSGWMSRQDDGKVRMTYGHVDVRIAEVTGLDTVQDLPEQKLTITPDLVNRARAFKPITPDAAVTEYTIKRGGPIPNEARIYEQDQHLTLMNGPQPVADAVLRYDDQNLYVGWRVFDMSAFMNQGAAFETAFKTGDSVNLFIAPEAEYNKNQIAGKRILLAPIAGKHVAVLYDPNSSGAPYKFTSPVRSSQFGFVALADDITYHVRGNKQDYMVSATIPWQRLGITPQPGLALKGDIGVLFGDQNNTRTSRRVQWVDKETNVVNDEPTESEFFPARWGTFTLE